MYSVSIEQVTSQPIAAARRRVPIPQIGTAWKPALDEVWAYLRQHRDLSPGHNVFLYHHPTQRDQPMDIDFGVAVGRRFTGADGVISTETPAGEVATTVHVGPYEKMPEGHKAVHAWCGVNRRDIGGMSWEIYGDWNDDPAKLETRIVYLLR